MDTDRLIIVFSFQQSQDRQWIASTWSMNGSNLLKPLATNLTVRYLLKLGFTGCSLPIKALDSIATSKSNRSREIVDGLRIVDLKSRRFKRRST
jgi:hypothetical protein